MAKALFGYATAPAHQASSHLQSENRMLRQRVEDLEATVARLQAENDQLAVVATDVLEPA